MWSAWHLYEHEQPVVGVPNCVICGIMLYLTPQNLNCDEIFWKIVETFGENVITEEKVIHQIFKQFSDGIRYCLGFEQLNKVWRHNWTQLPLVIPCSYWCHVSYIHHISVRFMHCDQNTKRYKFLWPYARPLHCSRFINELTLLIDDPSYLFLWAL